MKSRKPPVKSEPASVAHGEGSILGTVLRTLVLVVLTVGLMVLFRVWGPAQQAVIYVAGTRPWQSIYEILNLDSGLAREQALLIGIAVFCFLAALAIQGIGLVVIGVVRRRRASRRG